MKLITSHGGKRHRDLIVVKKIKPIFGGISSCKFPERLKFLKVKKWQ